MRLEDVERRRRLLGGQHRVRRSFFLCGCLTQAALSVRSARSLARAAFVGCCTQSCACLCRFRPTAVSRQCYGVHSGLARQRYESSISLRRAEAAPWAEKKQGCLAACKTLASRQNPLCLVLLDRFIVSGELAKAKDSIQGSGSPKVAFVENLRSHAVLVAGSRGGNRSRRRRGPRQGVLARVLGGQLRQGSRGR